MAEQVDETEIDFDAEEEAEQRERREDNGVAVDPVVADALDFFKLVSSESDTEQRALEESDLEFDAGEQWPADVKASRAKQTIAGIDIPARPMLTIPKLNQPVSLVINQIKKAHLGINVHPESEDANTETAEVLQGILRHIEVRSRGSIARNWAAERAAKAGRGYYRILKRYVDESGDGEHWTDQELVLARILNQGAVYLDPYATEPDWSDGERALIGGFYSDERYKRKWPKSKLTAMIADGGFDAEGDLPPNWMATDAIGKRSHRVMEFFRVEFGRRKRLAYKQGDEQLAGYLDDIAGTDEKAQDAWWQENKNSVVTHREVTNRKVMWYVLNAVEVLAQEEWDGPHIPILPVIGREQYYANKRRWVGIIRPAKDGQRLFNYAATAAVEKEALDTKAPWIGVEGQFLGHEEEWSQSATRNFPYLQVRGVSIAGQPAPMPQRNSVGPNLSGSLALLQAADEFIKASTFVHDPSLGNSAAGDSGRKVLALQKQGEEGNSDYLDNLATITMPFEAKQLLAMIPKVYDRPGRVQQILGIDDKPKKVILNAPFVEGPDGTPRAVDAEAGQGSPNAAMQPKRFDLSKGRYGLTVSIGKSYPSRLAEGSDEMSQLLQAAPDLLKVIGDIYFKFRDFPGHTEISERMKKMLPKELQDEQGQEDPQQLKAQLAQQSQALEGLQQQFGEAMKAIETKQVEMGAKVESEQVKADAAIALAQMKLDGELMLANIQAKLKLDLAELESRLAKDEKVIDIREARLTREDEQRHDVAMEEMKHEMAGDVAAVTHARQRAQGDVEHERGEQGAEREHERAESSAEAAHERMVESAGDEPEGEE